MSHYREPDTKKTITKTVWMKMTSNFGLSGNLGGPLNDELVAYLKGWVETLELIARDNNPSSCDSQDHAPSPRKRNVSVEERERRRQRMKAFWDKKRTRKVAGTE